MTWEIPDETLRIEHEREELIRRVAISVLVCHVCTVYIITPPSRISVRQLMEIMRSEGDT